MKQLRIYLKSELGKLANKEDGSWFLGCISMDLLKASGMPIDLYQLVQAFASQEKVNSFVDALPDASVESLAKTCDRDWRKNGVYETLTGSSVWSEKAVSVGLIDVQQAEPNLRYIFERNNFQLKRIAADAELWTQEPYSQWDLNSAVGFPILLGRFKAGRYELFDGIHRAILLAQRGEEIIAVCFYDA